MIRAVKVGDLALARGDRLLFRGLNFTLEAGQAISLVGRNGAGKTSLLRPHRQPAAVRRGAIGFEGEERPAGARGQPGLRAACTWPDTRTG